MKKNCANDELQRILAHALSKGDIYSSQIKTKVSVMIINSRVEQELSQQQFAKKMGVTQGMVSKWESGEYNFTIEAIADICEKLGTVPILELKNERAFSGYNKVMRSMEWNLQADNLKNKKSIKMSIAA